VLGLAIGLGACDTLATADVASISGGACTLARLDRVNLANLVDGRRPCIVLVYDSTMPGVHDQDGVAVLEPAALRATPGYASECVAQTRGHAGWSFGALAPGALWAVDVQFPEGADRTGPRAVCDQLVVPLGP
jgi:hypothetical protein